MFSDQCFERKNLTTNIIINKYLVYRSFIIINDIIHSNF